MKLTGDEIQTIIDEIERNLFEHPLGFEGIDEILMRKVVAIGNGAHINIPLKHLGKDAIVTIKSKNKL